MKIENPLPAALLAGVKQNRERLERLHEIKPASMAQFGALDDAPFLKPCALCTNGCTELHPSNGPIRRDRCTLCGGSGLLMTRFGEMIAKLLAHVLDPQLALDATDDAIAAFNTAAEKDHKAAQARAEVARKARVDEVRSMADRVARDPGLFERIQGLLTGEVLTPVVTESEESRVSARARAEFLRERVAASPRTAK